MNKYLDYLVEAFQKVDQKYYSWWSIKHFDGNPESKPSGDQRIERVFAFELYHQYRKQMEYNSSDFTDLLLNAEPLKSYVYEILAKDNYCLNNVSISHHSLIPDLVLHKGQASIGHENQKLTIEIKAQINPDVTMDINKILLMVDKFGFEFGVFLTINSNHEFIIDKVKESFDKNCFNRNKDKYANLFKKIIILNKKSIHDKIFQETLLNIINS